MYYWSSVAFYIDKCIRTVNCFVLMKIIVGSSIGRFSKTMYNNSQLLCIDEDRNKLSIALYSDNICIMTVNRFILMKIIIESSISLYSH